MARKTAENRALFEVALTAAHERPATTAIEAIAQLLAKPPAAAQPGLAGDLLLDFVVGARALRERLAELEIEAGIQAREMGVTPRQMATATGIAERNVRARYRREGDPATEAYR
jgi:hypothetical protein